MYSSIQTITRKATALLVVVAGVSAALMGIHFATGVVLSGVLLVGSFLFGSALTTNADTEGSENTSLKVPLLLTLKFPIVGGGALFLLSNYPPLSVLIGGGMLVMAISLDATQRLAAMTGEANGI